MIVIDTSDPSDAGDTSETRDADRGPGEARYVEHLSVPDLSVGTYHIPCGADDPQQPHTEDELYFVQSGRGRFRTPEQTVDVTAGTLLYVPAYEDHRFVDVTEDLTVLVMFGPAEGSRAAG